MCRCEYNSKEICNECHRKGLDKPVPHKHAELIKAWADGANIEYWSSRDNTWVSIGLFSPWGVDTQYRSKPEVKPDIIRFARAGHCEYDPNTSAGQELNRQMTGTWWTIYPSGGDNLKATFDGETGKLKSVEIL